MGGKFSKGGNSGSSKVGKYEVPSIELPERKGAILGDKGEAKPEAKQSILNGRARAKSDPRGRVNLPGVPQVDSGSESSPERNSPVRNVDMRRECLTRPRSGSSPFPVAGQTVLSGIKGQSKQQRNLNTSKKNEIEGFFAIIDDIVKKLEALPNKVGNIENDIVPIKSLCFDASILLFRLGIEQHEEISKKLLIAVDNDIERLSLQFKTGAEKGRDNLEERDVREYSENRKLLFLTAVTDMVNAAKLDRTRRGDPAKAARAAENCRRILGGALFEGQFRRTGFCENGAPRRGTW